MSDRLYFPTMNGTISASGTLTLSYQVNANENVDISGIRIVSAGTLSVIGIRDSSGQQYTNAGSGNKLPSTFFQSPATSFLGIPPFPIPINLPGASSIYFDLLDTSSAGNALTILLIAVRHVT